MPRLPRASLLLLALLPALALADGEGDEATEVVSHGGRCTRALVRGDDWTNRCAPLAVRARYRDGHQTVLFAIEGCEPHYQIIVERTGAIDVLEIRIEVTENIFFDEMKMQRAFLEKIEKRIESVLGVGVTVKLVEPNSIPRFEGKASRVIDRRQL